MKIELVHGAPCSGKSTYVKNKMKKNDIRYDFDALCKALNGNENHMKNRENVRPYVIDFRYDILSRIKNVDEQKNAKGTLYFISNNYSDSLLEELQEVAETTVHEVEATREECLEHLKNDDTRPEKDVWAKKINEYFDAKEKEENEKGDEERMKNDIEDKLNSRQYRSMTMQVRALADGDEEDYIVEGYATTFNQPYLLFENSWAKVMEQVDRNAFKECDMSDVIFQYNHEGRVFARTRNKTLQLVEDDHGLKVIADLGGTEIGRNLYEEIKGGYTDKMSFGFVVDESKLEILQSGDYFEERLRTITKIKKLYDVSAVSIPANDFTEISSKRDADGVIKQIEAERLARLERKKEIEILELKIKLLGDE